MSRAQKPGSRILESTKPTDFIVTIHAFERLEERFPELVKGKSDEAQAFFIHSEVMDAIESGREGKVAPLELAPSAEMRWISTPKDGSIVWTQDKMRGYVLQQTDEGLLVLTVLEGTERTKKQQLWRVPRGMR